MEFLILNYVRLHMSSNLKNKQSKGFPWKAIFGAITILGLMVLFSKPNNSNIEQISSKETKSLGFSLK
jgi:uncharacterized membrane protein HdeD (DUF308 family)